MTVLIVNAFFETSFHLHGRASSTSAAIALQIRRLPPLYPSSPTSESTHSPSPQRKQIFAGWTGVRLMLMGRATRGRCSVRARDRIEGVRRKLPSRMVAKGAQRRLLMTVPCPARLREHSLLPSLGMGAIRSWRLASMGCGVLSRSCVSF